MYERKLMSGFMRIHVLHHASSPEGTYGLWMIEELRRHGYNVSPGTMYPMLREMENAGLLQVSEENIAGSLRRIHRTTEAGRSALEALKVKVRELQRELDE